MHPAKFLKNPAISTFLAHGSSKTLPIFLTKDTRPFSSLIPFAILCCLSASAFALSYASFCFSALDKKTPLPGSLTKTAIKPETASEMAAMRP